MWYMIYGQDKKDSLQQRLAIRPQPTKAKFNIKDILENKSFYSTGRLPRIALPSLIKGRIKV